MFTIEELVGMFDGIPVHIPDVICINFFEWDSTSEYGMSLPYPDRYEDVLDLVREHANFVLPSGVWYEIRAAIPQDFGRSKGIAWYTHPFYTRIERDFKSGYDSSMGLIRVERRMSIGGEHVY